MKSTFVIIFKILDPIISILILPSLILLKIFRRLNLGNFYFISKLIKIIGVFPIIDSFYEPKFIFNKKYNKKNRLEKISINFNINEQLDFLKKLNFENELNTDLFKEILNSKNFCSGDMEYWYQILRKIKPKNIIEIGSGTTTKIADLAIKKNLNDLESYNYHYIAIDPFAKINNLKSKINVIKNKVENVSIDIFKKLEENDILFVDSSHIIRPDGDLLFIFLEILPILNKGVIVHFHDIFTPYDYPDKWKYSDIKFWNEQYLLEAILINSNTWKVFSSINYLKENYYEELKRVCPFLKEYRRPGSFYIQKVK